MRTITTTVSTGDTVIKGGMTGKVGNYKHGIIQVKWKVNDTSCVSDFYTTRKLNQLINNGTIKIQQP